MRFNTRFLTLLIVLLAAGACAPAPEDNRSAVSRADPIPCFMISDPIEIDGSLDEPAWTQAPSIPLRFDAQGRPVSPIRAEARFLWDGTDLYAAITARDRDIASTLSGRDSRLWEEDVLELFIKPAESSSIYYEFQFSPTNQIFDAYWIRRGGPLDQATLWNSRLRTAVEVDGTLNRPEDDDQGWTVELALPLSDLHHAVDSPPRPGEVWKAAVCRYDYDQRWKHPKNTATAPVTDRGGFHEYEVYGLLKFEGPKPAETP